MEEINKKVLTLRRMRTKSESARHISLSSSKTLRMPKNQNPRFQSQSTRKLDVSSTRFSLGIPEKPTNTAIKRLATASFGAKGIPEISRIKNSHLQNSASPKRKFERKQMERIVEFDEDISNLESSCASLSLDDTTSQEQSIARRSIDKSPNTGKTTLDLRKSKEIC